MIRLLYRNSYLWCFIVLYNHPNIVIYESGAAISICGARDVYK